MHANLLTKKGEKGKKKILSDDWNTLSLYCWRVERDQESISVGRKSIIYQGQEKGNIIPLTSSLAKRRKVL